MATLLRTTAIGQPRWPGLDRDFHQALMTEGMTPAGKALRARAEGRFRFSESKPFLLGPAQMVAAEWSGKLREITEVYHRAIEAIVRASVDDEEVRTALASPPPLVPDLDADVDPANSRVHICRLDLLLCPDGDFKILETNANCPGGFVYSGICSRAWREFMEARGFPMPPALDHEGKGFMAKWLLAVMEEEAGGRPDYLALLREEGGNRLELGDFAKHVQWEGIDCEELDPREIELAGSGPPTARGRPLTHAYLKLGMQPFFRLRAHLDAFVRAVRERRLFVQNGQRARWVGDNKLCLAVISDPGFRRLFDPADWALLQKHVPWSRNVGLLDREQLDEVRGNQAGYVLKRGLDTRGQGVVVGRGVAKDEWRQALEVARSEGWLVQAFAPTCWIERDFGDCELQRHDLALGAINGRLTTLFMRSSSELRVNMARTGRMHPVFMAS